VSIDGGDGEADMCIVERTRIQTVLTLFTATIVVIDRKTGVVDAKSMVRFSIFVSLVEIL
jgi:hypothetical protein